MIVASLLLVIVAAVTLVIGLFNPENANWVWTSIGCCLLAGLLLIIGVLRSRPRRKPVLQSGTDQPASWSGASSWSGATNDAALSRDDTGDVRVIGSEPDVAAPSDTAGIAPAPTGGTAGDETQQWAPQPSVDDTPAAADTGGSSADDVALSPADPWAELPTDTDANVAAPAEAPAPVDVDVPAGADTPATVAAPAAEAKPRATRRTSTPGMSDEEKINAALAGIAGVGPTKRTALIQTFGTYRKLRAAPVERIAAVPGISRTLAERIHKSLHS